MRDAPDSLNDARPEARTDYDWVHKEVAAEVLKHAQAMVAAQHAALAAVDSKLAATLGQSVTLGAAAFGAAALPFAEKAWMPSWAGFGLLAAGACAAAAALVASRGLDTRAWAAPGIPPEDTHHLPVLSAEPATAMMLMAWGYQKGIDANRKAAMGPAQALRWALKLLAAAPVAGAAAATLAAAALGRFGVH